MLTSLSTSTVEIVEKITPGGDLTIYLSDGTGDNAITIPVDDALQETSVTMWKSWDSSNRKTVSCYHVRLILRSTE